MMSQIGLTLVITLKLVNGMVLMIIVAIIAGIGVVANIVRTIIIIGVIFGY